VLDAQRRRAEGRGEALAFALEFGRPARVVGHQVHAAGNQELGIKN